MRAAFVISGHRGWRRAVSARFTQKFGVPVCDVEFPLEGEPHPNSGQAGYWIADQFRLLADRVEDFASEHGGAAVLRDAVGVLDFCSAHSCTSWDGIELLHERKHPAITVAGFLMLAFPEVHWILQTPLDGPDKFFNRIHTLAAGRTVDETLESHFLGFCALFDPAGLRARLRECLGRQETGQTVYPVRTKMAVIVDEEPAYAYFSSLAAFRCGYRALPIMTWRALRIWLGQEGIVPSLTFEDVYLNFPDRPRDFDDKEYRHTPSLGHRGLSNLAFRDQLARRLRDVKAQRLLVTAGPGKDKQRRRVWELSWNYLSAQSCRAAKLFKPVAGIYLVLRKAKLWDASRGAPRFPDGFRMCAPYGDPPHSAPGRLLMVAERLLSRGARLLDSRPSVVDAVHVAVLAIEAKELLGYQTPTTSLEAIALQHEAESVAEGAFLGVDYNLNVRDRLREIETEVRAVSERFHSSRIRRSAINAQLAIAERLAKRLHDLNQVEEERACLAKARQLRFDFWVRERPWPFRWVMWLPLWYLAFVLSSLVRLMLSVVGGIVVFGFVYYSVAPWTHTAWKPEVIPAQVFESLAASAFFTFTLQPADGWSRVLDSFQNRAALWHLLMAFQGAISFTNLGLFLSHLYMIVSRR